MKYPNFQTPSSLGTTNRYANAILVGSTTSRNKKGALGRIYNYCHAKQAANPLVCALPFIKSM
jgi:hypothetical protein